MFTILAFLPMIILLVLAVLVTVSMWKIFKKAGQPGWGSIVPFYNLYLITKIARRPGWWTVLFFIPIANIIFLAMAYNDMAKNFGKDVGFTVGIILLPFIFIPILGLGSAEYQVEE